MNKKIPYLYALIVLLGSIFLIYIGVTFTNYKYTTSAELPIFSLNNLTNESTDPYVKDLRQVLPSVLAIDTYLGFFTVHQNVEVLINDTLIYSYMAGNNEFGHTPGSVWHYIRLPNDSEGQEIRIYLNSPYLMAAKNTPSFLLGSPLSLYMQLLKEHFPSFALCILTIIIGIVLIFYWINIHRSSVKIDSCLFYLGIFSITYGLYTLSESQISIFLFSNYILFSYASYLLRMLIPLPFLLFIRNLYQNKNSPIWSVLCCLSIGNILLCTALQIMNIADFAETLWITHIIILLYVFSTLILTIIEIRRYSFHKLLKLNIICFGFVILGITVNFSSYYMGFSSNGALSRITFLVYIIVPAFAGIENISRLVKRGAEAEIYRKMAYYDLLTKLRNRNAYMEALADIRASKNYPFIIICDLNNLKRCNDIFGHEYGDNYVQDASAILRSSFSSIGKCYRIGGDEFCILLDVSLKDTAIELLSHINETWSLYHDLPESFEPSIAYGYAAFDPVIDHNFNDTMKRADSMMYINKKASKLFGSLE